MQVQSLTLKNFRNVSESILYPDRSLNFLLGNNGQGKTSFLEALGFLATLRSFRGSKAAEVIQCGTQQSEVKCELVPESQELAGWKTELKVSFAFTDFLEQRASKVAFINGKPYKSSTHYLSQRFGHYEMGFHSVVFNPSDHDLVRNDPATRRAYLDRVLAAEDSEYLKAFQKYQRILDQRNALLKSSDEPSPELLIGFTETMGKSAAFLTYKRLEWIQRLAVRLDEMAHYIAPRQPFLRLVYLSNWAPPVENLSITNNNLGSIHFSGQGPLPSLELLEQAFWKRQSSLESAEWRTGHSLVGPHRDDWAFFLGNQVLKGHGSQGEVRSALLALKISEIELFRSATGHRPIFLLDDFSSELDQERRSFLLKFLSRTDLQVFVTTTENAFPIGKHYWVAEGKLQTSPMGPMALKPELPNGI